MPSLLRSMRASLVLACASVGLCAAELPLDSLPYTPSLDINAMDRSVEVCEDLYTYACGGWQKSHPIPADQTGWSVYGKLENEMKQFLWGILKGLGPENPTRTAWQTQIGDYFAACMDEAAVERRGLEPIEADLARIDALRTPAQVAPLLGALQQRYGAQLFFSSDSEQDAQEATRVIAGLSAGGLGLPDRDYYEKTDPKSIEIRAHYLTHVARMFELLGESPPLARQHAAVVVRLESALAHATLTQVQQRDPHAVYHRFTLAALHALAPRLDWGEYFKSTGMAPAPWLNVAQPKFFHELNQQLNPYRFDDLKVYLRWAVLASAAPYLSKALVGEHFAFHRQYLRGAVEDQPRWKKCVAAVDADLGEALGREFVGRVFPSSDKQRTVYMTQHIETAMRRRIEGLDWMSPATKQQALAKLALIRNKVGYPDQWRDYSALRVSTHDYFGNTRRAAEFEYQRQAAKIGQPVDLNEWGMTPPTVNAYYDPPKNDINFPAGVLMPPLYDTRSDAAPNYGDTGGTIGHELTHAFDDEGRQFDGHGNLRDWWTKADAAAFEKRAQCVRDQYSSYTVVDDIKIQGALTSGEDIADLGGEILALLAWREDTHNLLLPDRDGLSAEQRFFVGFAQWACANERPQQLRVHALTDPHSPPKYRINGVVSNLPEFAQAFHCHAGQALVKPAAQQCKVW